MNEAKEKTALCTSVGADERQSVQNTISSISALDTEVNHPDENSPENFAGDTPVWNGSATELVALLGEDIQPNILTRRLNVKAGELLNEYSIEYTVKRTRSGSFISLARKAV